MLEVGQHLELTIDDVAHGGSFIARHEGVVVFVRATDIGERVLAQITKIGSQGRFAFAEVVTVLAQSINRIEPPCGYAGVCGGCDFQHINISHQLNIKRNVILNSLKKFAGIDSDRWSNVTVKPLEALHYRTRMRYQSTPTGDFGLFRAESNAVVLIDECKIAEEKIAFPKGEIGVVSKNYKGFVGVDSPKSITEHVGDFVYELDTHCFWQAHRDAPSEFVEIVLRLANLQHGDAVWDLYAGVGLFTLPAASRVGENGSVIAVEGDKRSARFLANNTKGLQQARSVQSDVYSWVSKSSDSVDVVILDPPRKGAGREVMTAIIEKNPRAIVYVACDPVALARDISTAMSLGYELAELEAVDAYPQTHHVETFALLVQARIQVEVKA